ncbi:hypothetical protein CVT26_005501 [Gymnopilus dilepis]|uniref:Uncharacterized protein n=1 Tax=Gymnopilus dilepis TaxID=231916 RepID=A0A409WJP1_9AGAR|nr:hypothetical protein CVT26_005501 [Gymnopilus dilepis]
MKREAMEGHMPQEFALGHMSALEAGTGRHCLAATAGLPCRELEQRKIDKFWKEGCLGMYIGREVGTGGEHQAAIVMPAKFLINKEGKSRMGPMPQGLALGHILGLEIIVKPMSDIEGV